MAREIENEQSVPESAAKKETPSYLFDVVHICGDPGSGTTTLAKNLKARLEKAGYDVLVVKRGYLLRQEAIENTGEDITGYYDRPVDKDKELDTLTAKLMMGRDYAGRVVILDSRLGGWISKKLRDAQVQMSANTISILLTAKADTRYHRVFERGDKKSKQMAYRDTVRNTRQRKIRDAAAFALAYPELYGIDVLSPRNRDEKGEPIYDKVINTTKISPNIVANIAEAFIKAKGLASKPQKSS